MEGKTIIESTGGESYLVSTPIYAGRYRMGNDYSYMDFCLIHKPKWLHRKFCYLLLGWKWIDEKDVK